MVAGGEHVEPQALVPESARTGHQAEGVPEVQAAFGRHARVVGQPALHQRQQGGVHEQRRRGQALVLNMMRENSDSMPPIWSRCRWVRKMAGGALP